MSENQTQPYFGLEKIYLKDVSYEAPGVPSAFQDEKAPEIGMQLLLEHGVIDAANGYYEVLLKIQISAKRNLKPVFLVEVQQAGVFRITGVAEDMLNRTLETSCAYVLLPFAREAIGELIAKGGFPQLLINPINFDALYDEKRKTSNKPAQGRV